MTLANMLRETGLDLLALVWPTECVGCRRADRDCCDSCSRKIRSAESLLHGGMLPGVRAPAFVGGAYEGPLRAVLVAYKHGGRVGFARHLAPQLRELLTESLRLVQGNRPPLIVPAPSRPSRVRERGYRHLEMLLRISMRGQRSPRPRMLRALRTLRGRTSQVGLKLTQREQNATRICVRRSTRALLKGREVVLFDDVITTGATVRAAQQTLEDAGARVIAVVALCIVVRRDTRQNSGTGNPLL